MFNISKKLKKLEDKYRKLERNLFLLEYNFVECEGCNCIVRKIDENMVINDILYDYYSSSYYCKKCKPPYDKVKVDNVKVNKYYKDNVEVTKTGKPKRSSKSK